MWSTYWLADSDASSCCCLAISRRRRRVKLRSFSFAITQNICGVSHHNAAKRTQCISIGVRWLLLLKVLASTERLFAKTGLPCKLILIYIHIYCKSISKPRASTSDGHALAQVARAFCRVCIEQYIYSTGLVRGVCDMCECIHTSSPAAVRYRTDVLVNSAEV